MGYGLMIKEDYIESKLPEGVTLMVLDKDNINWLWANINKYDSLFSDFAQRDFGGFLKRLCDKDTVCFKISENSKDVGYIYLEQIQIMRDCKFHGATFDRQFKGKEEYAKAVIELAFDLFRLERMSASVPDYARYAKSFLGRLGFKKEGRIRRGFKHKGEWYDVYLYGILKSEVT